MKDETWFRDLIAERENEPGFQTEELLLEITEQISARLRELNMRPADLAQRLGVSRAAVSQLLNGRPNMTMRTLVGIAHALDQRVRVALESKSSAQQLSRYGRRVHELYLDHDDVPCPQAPAVAA